jgi:phosphate-selective porin OprO/OprP
MKTTTTRVSGILLGVVLMLTSALGQDNSPPPSASDELRALREKVAELERKLKSLEDRVAATDSATNAKPQGIEALDQKVRVLEHNQEMEREAAEANSKDQPRVSVGEHGFSLSSADTNFTLRLKGVLQVDSRTFFEDSGIVGNDSILLRRARPMLEGTVFRDVDFLFVPDFGGSGAPQIYDAYLNYRYSPALQLQAGKFKSPVGLEQLQMDRDIFFNERSLATDLVPNRDMGFMLHGDLFDGTLSYAAGIFNGVGDARISSNVSVEDNKAFAGRLFVEPFKPTPVKALQGLGLGISGSYEALQGANTTDLPNNNGFATVGQEMFFTYSPTNRSVVAEGVHWRLSPQAWYFYGPFHLLGEYVISDQEVGLASPGRAVSADLQNTAWQIAGGWVVTGEKASFRGITPREPFNPRRGHWGAWQLIARYSRLDVDPSAFPLFADSFASARSAREWSAGVNWYLNANLRFATSFSHTEFEGGGIRGSAGLVTRNDENVLFTRLQLAF